jgi:tetratricopeptide (TPR) repeat protein
LIQARGFYERALAIDPRSTGAMVGMAYVDVTLGVDLLPDERAALLSAAETNAIKALSVAPDVTGAHMILALVYIATNRAAQGISECEQALAIDRNLAYAHGAIGLAKLHMGRPADTEGHVLEAFRLSSRDLSAYRLLRFVGVAKLHLGADAEAVGWLRRSIEANRNHPPPILRWPLLWAHSARWMRREPLRRRDLRSTQALPSAAFAPPNRVTIRRSLLGRSACARACA